MKFSRRTFVKAASGLFLTAAVVKPVQRFFPLDQTMVSPQAPIPLMGIWDRVKLYDTMFNMKTRSTYIVDTFGSVDGVSGSFAFEFNRPDKTTPVRVFIPNSEVASGFSNVSEQPWINLGAGQHVPFSMILPRL